MANFAYVARERSGRVVQGTIDAADIREAAGKLRQENLLISKLNPVGAKASSSGKNDETKSRGRISLKEKMFLTKQFYVMLKAGLGMLTCFNNLYVQTENKYLKYIVNEIRRDVEGGTQLSEAFNKFPNIFEKMFIHMVEAGEASGKLETSFLRLNEYYEREYTLKKKVVSAMVYPVVIVCVAIIAVIILMTFVVPMFVSMFEDSGKSLPMITLIVMYTSKFMKNFWYLMVLMPVAGFFGYKAARKNPASSAVLDKMWLRAPLFGELIRRLAISRFTRTLSTLLESGVPILQSLEIVQRAVNNAVLSSGIQQAAINVSRGMGLATTIEGLEIFPPMVSQMIAIGEESGDLARLLTEVADYYDKEVEYAVENLMAMIEPMIIVGLGGIVGFIVVAIYLPMFDLSSGATLQ